jgi:hypothetical protein
VFVSFFIFSGWVLGKPVHIKRHMSNIQRVEKYFDVWNKHDVEGIKALHASASSLKDWECEFLDLNQNRQPLRFVMRHLFI